MQTNTNEFSRASMTFSTLVFFVIFTIVDVSERYVSNVTVIYEPPDLEILKVSCQVILVAASRCRFKSLRMSHKYVT